MRIRLPGSQYYIKNPIILTLVCSDAREAWLCITSSIWYVNSFMSVTGEILNATILFFPANDRTVPRTRTYVFSLMACTLSSSGTDSWMKLCLYYNYYVHNYYVPICLQSILTAVD